MNVENVQMSLYLFQASLITWIRVASPCILFGLYYGLLSTLPIGPSHIISIRSFLLRGTTSGLAALVGLMMGQLLIFLSIFCSPLYLLIIKPHFITLLIVPYITFYWFRTTDLSDYKASHPIGLLIDSRIYNSFLESFILQILNPILLPSPVLARLIHIFVFRYSNNGMFLISTLMGWLIGHILFLNLSRLLLTHLETDSSILYLLIKRIIHNTFSILIYINVLLYLGRAPVSLFTHKLEDKLVLLEDDFCRLPNWIAWMFKQWPTSCFDQYRPNRPIRYLASWLNGNNPVKTQVSTFFFDKCLSDGKERINFTALPSLSIFENQLQFLEPLKKRQFNLNDHKYWIYNHSRNKEAIINELRDRIRSLDTKCILSETKERRTELVYSDKEIPPKQCNPFLSHLDRIRYPISKSFWIFYDLLDSKIENPLIGINNEYIQQDDYLKYWIYTEYQQLSFDKIPLPWEAIPPIAQDIFFFMFEDSEDIRIQDILKEIDILSKEEGLSSIWDWEVTWGQISHLPLPERTLFFICLREDYNGFDWIDLLDMSSINKDEEEESFYSKQRLRSTYKIEEMLKELPEEYEIIIDNPFDIVGGITDIRNRKFKNLGISIEKTLSKPKRIIKRFSETTDFRRELIKGSMRSRRRKMLVCNLFQEKGHSPFFLRLKEMPNESQRSMQGFIDSERLTIDSEQETNKESYKELPSSLPSKNIQVVRSLLSARLDVGSIHTGRSLLLVLQSNLRKYVKLPILITFKNIVRISLFQTPEWNEDWSEYHKESRIYCTYDGEEFSDTDLPARWLKEGLQIKIVYPFQLKPWHNHKKRESIADENRIRLQEPRKKAKPEKEEFRATYLTIWGFQTDRPFGIIQKEPSFWKPIRRELRKTWKKNLLLRTREIDSFCSRLNIPIRFSSTIRRSLRPLERSRSRMIQEGYRQTDATQSIILSETKEKQEINNQKIDEESIHIPNGSYLLTDIEKERVSESLIGLESKSGFLIYQLKDLLPNKIDTDDQSIKSFHSSKEEINKRLKNANLTISLLFRKNIIDIQKRIIIFHLGIRRFIDKYFLIAISIQRIHRTFSRYSFLFTIFPTQLVRIIKDTVQNDTYIGELTLSIPSTDKEMFQLDNKSIEPLSQAYIYDNFWYTNGTDNVNLTDFTTILEGNEILKHLENQGGLDKDYNWNDYEEEFDSKEYNTLMQNDDLSIKRTRSSKSLYDKKSKTKKKDLFECLHNRTQIIQQYIDEPIKEFVRMHGLSKQLSDLITDDWKKWLSSFNRYNLPLEIWRKIAPQEWRMNAEKINRFDEIEKNLFERQKSYVYEEKKDDFCFYMENPLLRDRIKNLNKRHKNIQLLCNLVSSIQRHGSQVLKNNIRQEKESWSEDRIENLITRKKGKIFDQQISNLKRELISKIDFALWIVPQDINNKKDLSKTGLELTFEPKTCFMKDTCFLSVLDEQLDSNIEDESTINLVEMPLRDRLYHYFPSQWEWKSEAMYKRFQKFKDLLFLLNVLPDEHDLAAYIGIDPDLVTILFAEEDIDYESLEDLFLCSSHRFSRIFDDQLLMYKLVSILLRFKDRFRKRLDTDFFDECKLRLLLIDETKDLPDLYNIDDILLPKSRRESQVLGSIEIPKHVEPKEGYMLYSPFCVQKTSTNEEAKESSKVQRIKRFLWPSHRLEELACINRFYFNTTDGSRFAILRIRMYTLL